jgi:hypothetical protein
LGLPQPLLGAAGAEKEAYNPNQAPATAYRPTHPHTRRYNPDVQDAEHIRDVLK